MRCSPSAGLVLDQRCCAVHSGLALHWAIVEPTLYASWRRVVMESYMKGWSFIMISGEHVWTRSRIRESYEWLKKWMNRCAARVVFVTFTCPSQIRTSPANSLSGYWATIRDSAALGYARLPLNMHKHDKGLDYWIAIFTPPPPPPHLDGSFVPVVARNSEVLGSNPSRSDICHRAYIQCSKLFKGLECAVLSGGTVHY